MTVIPGLGRLKQGEWLFNASHVWEKKEINKKRRTQSNSLQSLPLVHLPSALFPLPPRAAPGRQHHLCLEVCNKQTGDASSPLQSQNLLLNEVPNESLAQLKLWMFCILQTYEQMTLCLPQFPLWDEGKGGGFSRSPKEPPPFPDFSSYLECSWELFCSKCEGKGKLMTDLKIHFIPLNINSHKWDSSTGGTVL